jgi:hypothetical protein
MNRLGEAAGRLLRGPWACRLLQRLGIEPRRFWLLTDLFGQLAERREMTSHLGHNTAALRLNAWILCGMTGLAAVLMLLAQIALAKYFAIFLAMTGVMLAGILFSETGNSLVNPVEGLVLAHQPIDGATYTAAKLTHLARILLYLVPALDGIPAICGLLLGAPWYYPLLHLAAAFLLGCVIALFCCAVFGWLIRFIPARRLKAAGQIAEIVPWTLFLAFQYTRGLFQHIHPSHWLPTGIAALAGLGLAAAGVSVGAVVMGLRCLSGDYLVRISAIVHGSSGAKAGVRRSRTSDLVAWCFGGPPSRAGFEFVSRMTRRDWQFRRQLIPMLPATVMLLVGSAHELRTSPFSGRFTGAQVAPHFFGGILFLICPLLVYGSDYQGAWLFLLAPGRALGPFARGIFAWLWLRIIVMPHVVLLGGAAWFWGMRDAALFTLYSVAVASFYLGLELRLIDGVPFSKPPEPTRQNYLLPFVFLGGGVMAVAVGVQYFFLFHSRPAVLLAALAVGAAACLVTRASLDTFESAIRFNLGLMSAEAKVLYREVEG